MRSAPAVSAVVVCLLTHTALCAFAQSGITVVGKGSGAPLQAAVLAQVPILVSPGEMVTLFLAGVKTVLPAQSPGAPRFLSSTVTATSLPLPTALAGFSATLRQGSAYSKLMPIFSVQQFGHCSDLYDSSPDCFLTALTVQVPFDIGMTAAVDLVISENGVDSRSFQLGPVDDQIRTLGGFLGGCNQAPLQVELGRFPCRSVVTHADGSPVTIFPGDENLRGTFLPAKPGEVVTTWAVGLGNVSPAVVEGQPAPTKPVPLVQPLAATYEYGINLGPKQIWLEKPGYTPPPTLPPLTIQYSGLAPGLAGLYQINFVVPPPPPGTPPCGESVRSNLTVTFGGLWSFDGATMCVDTSN